MADNAEILGETGETGESLEMGEPTPLPPPTIDDIEIPPPPEEDAPPPPPLDEDTPLDLPPGEDPNPRLPSSDDVSTAAEHNPVASEEPQGTAILDASKVTDPGSTGKDQTLPSDYGSPLPPYDSGIEAPSTSTADMSGMEGKALQSDFDEIQIEGPEEQNESSSGIHNANTLPSTRPMKTTTKTTVANQQALVTGYVEMSPEETKAEMKRVSTYRREAVMWVTIFLLLAGAIAVIFYFTYNITTLSDASLPDGEFRVRAVMILNHPWEDDLAVSSTSSHVMLADNITEGINSTFTDQSSEFEDVFQGTDMIYFSDEDGSTRVSFQCEFSGSPSDDIETRPAFGELFVSELEDGFDAGNFYELDLKDDQPIDVVQFAAL